MKEEGRHHHHERVIVHNPNPPRRYPTYHRILCESPSLNPPATTLQRSSIYHFLQAETIKIYQDQGTSRYFDVGTIQISQLNARCRNIPRVLQRGDICLSPTLPAGGKDVIFVLDIYHPLAVKIKKQPGAFNLPTIRISDLDLGFLGLEET